MGVILQRAIEVLYRCVIVPPVDPLVTDAELEFCNAWFCLNRIYGIKESIHSNSIHRMFVSSFRCLVAHVSSPPF